KGSLTGGHVVAATGTMSANGTVGDVGGVAEKTVAVQRAGATYFIVPQVEVATARANAAPGLTVLGVTSLAQALKDLRALGGVTPTALTRPS
ncbi:MAG TPA: PDZ domain-containing protein, partial [Acidimicrobiales bacterium]|nr:PDZ domain-containing protein [Acidimicrobiales bacterium]